MARAYLLVLICVAAIAGGQLIFKYVGNRLAVLSVRELASNPDVFLVFATGIVLYGATTILWVLALRDLPLHVAYVFMSLAFVLVPLGAWLVFGEALTPKYMAGALLIVTGILVSVS